MTAEDIGHTADNDAPRPLAEDGKPGCPVMVWDGPYRHRCGLGAAVSRCAYHGPFTTTPAPIPPVEQPAENDAPTYADGIEAGARLAALYDTGEAASAALMVAARMAREVAAQAPIPPVEHHPKCYQNTGVPDDLPPGLCDCRVLRMLDAEGVIPPASTEGER